MHTFVTLDDSSNPTFAGIDEANVIVVEGSEVIDSLRKAIPVKTYSVAKMYEILEEKGLLALCEG